NAWHRTQTERPLLRGARRDVNEAPGYRGRQGGNDPKAGPGRESAAHPQAIDLPAAPAVSSGGSRPRAGEPDEVLDGHAPPAAKERHGSIRELGAVTQHRRQPDRAARLDHAL